MSTFLGPRPHPSPTLSLPPPLLELREVRYAYPDGTPALRGVSMRLTEGEKVALVGLNGAGKSTLLLHLNGILRSTSGTVLVDGAPVSNATLRHIRARVGMLFQDPDDQLFSPTVFDDVAFGPLHMGMAEAEVRARVSRALEQVGMSGVERRMPHHLSLGQRKRVALATVLAMDPMLLALDEPSAGLDPRARRDLIALLGALPQAMLVATHDLAMVAEVFPRVIVLHEGLVVYDGPGAPLLADTALLEQYGLG
ncbi:MAG: energy-coupling factor ABC transporter ATP-binding protein [Chloroflexaceae bacterium]